jgi:hypothetical protein
VVLLIIVLLAGCNTGGTDRAVSDAKAITSFMIGTSAGVIDEDVITITVPYDTDITALAPVILFTGSAVSPVPGAAQDFSGPVTYRVTADDGSTKDYMVTVQLKGCSPLEITLLHKKIDLTADSENDLSRTQKDTLQITADGTMVRWFIDGEEQSETGITINIAAIHYPVGIHHVTALVYNDGIPYSDELIFKVIK